MSNVDHIQKEEAGNYCIYTYVLLDGGKVFIHTEEGSTKLVSIYKRSDQALILFKKLLSNFLNIVNTVEKDYVNYQLNR